MKTNLPNKNSKYHQGFYKPVNPHKYVGDPNKIIYRSGLERRFFKWLDTNSSVVRFAAEEFHIPYISPVDGRPHRYFVDVVFELTNGRKIVAEIKPYSQTHEPFKPKTSNKKSQRRYLTECMTWAVNTAKWEAAHRFCSERGLEFILLTEKNLPRSLG